MVDCCIESPEVTVVLPCRNEALYLEKCIRSIFSQSQPRGGMEVIVADGMSNDGSREILEKLKKEYPSLQVVDNLNKITPCGLNAAIRKASGKIIVRMDAHSEYASDYIIRCMDAIQATGAENVGGPARTKAKGYWQRAISAAYHCPIVVGGAKFHNVEYEGFVDTVVYGCWLRSTFEKFGFFDEELVRNQDDEHNLRINRGGGRVWQSPGIRSWYIPRGSLGSLFRQYMQYGYWKVRVIQKHRLPAAIRHLVPGLFILSCMILALGGLFSAFCLKALIALNVCYGLLNIMAAIWSATNSSWSLLPVLPAVVFCYQIGYGWGFLRGIWDFVIRGKGASVSLTKLTRENRKRKVI